MPQGQLRRSPPAPHASAGVSGISPGVHGGDVPELTAALIDIGRWLANAGYRFTTITPDSHAIIHERRRARTAVRELTDIFGWNLPFQADELDPELLGMLDAAGLLAADRDALRTSVRFSSIGDRVYAHSAFPTCGEDDVFFGPDTYRFVHAARRLIPSCDLLIDVGCGSGAGGLELADRCGHVVLADINPRALAFAAANCAINGVTAAATLHADVLDQAPRQPDAIIANPPYLIDAAQRTYRHGGGGYGTDLAVRIALEGVARIAAGGMVLIYTGSPVIRGQNIIISRLLAARNQVGCPFDLAWDELDPDVFGSELRHPAYEEVDRIALVVATLRRREKNPA